MPSVKTRLDVLLQRSADQREVTSTGAFGLEERALYQQRHQLGARFPAAGAMLWLSLGEAGELQTRAQRAG